MYGGMTNKIGILSKKTLAAAASIIVGGDFLNFNSTGATRIAGLNSDGSLNSGFNTGTGFDASLRCIVPQSDGKLLCAGIFNNYNGTARGLLARLNSNGTIDSGFAPTSLSAMYWRSIALQSDGKIIIIGDFTNRIKRLNSDGTTDTSFNSGTGIGGGSIIERCVSVQSDGKIIVGGNLTSYNGTSRNRILRINTDGSLDTGFTIGTGFNNVVWDVLVQSDGKIVASGAFTSYNGTAINRIARLNTDGTLDTGFSIGTGFDAIAYALAIQTDGKILVGGIFTTFNGTSSNGIARLNTDGSLDTGFSVGTGFNATSLWTIKIQTDNKILVGGRFTTYNGTTKNNIARLNTDGSLDTGFTGSADNSVGAIAIK